MPLPSLIHFTEGGPWHGYTDQPYAKEWAEELAHMMVGENPRGSGSCDGVSDQLTIEVIYAKK